MAFTNPLTFLQQVRAETAKVTWPSRREVTISTIMVLVLSTLVAVLFFFIDWFIRFGLGELIAIFA